jgi:hypothetical protein
MWAASANTFDGKGSKPTKGQLTAGAAAPKIVDLFPVPQGTGNRVSLGLLNFAKMMTVERRGSQP